MAKPFGFTLPFRVASDTVTAVAASVVTTGVLANLKEAIFVAHGHVPPKVPTYSWVVQKVWLSEGSIFVAV